MDTEIESGIEQMDTVGESLAEVDKELDSVAGSLRDLDVHLASLRKTLKKINSHVPFVDIADDAPVKDPEDE
jgi:archaellum component FlaC